MLTNHNEQVEHATNPKPQSILVFYFSLVEENATLIAQQVISNINMAASARIWTIPDDPLYNATRK